MSVADRVSGSFRDPAGQVHEVEGKIYRTVTKFGAPAFQKVLETGFLERLVNENKLVRFEQVTDSEILSRFPDAVMVLQHPKLDYISFPYEWSFSLLKQAALLHLDVAMQALDASVTLTDATAYNIQFVGNQPVFIDHLSFRPYIEREYWMGHRQFCEQFLNPLLLRAKLGVAHNAWFRGALEGVTNQDMSALLGARHRFSAKMLAHVILPAQMQRKADSKANGITKPISERRGLEKYAYKGLLSQLHGWISGLEPKDKSRGAWGSYDNENTYADDENSQKSAFIEAFTDKVKPQMVFDLGCNSGAFSEVALKAGAKQAIGFDFDQTSLEKAYRRASERSLNFLPLYLDASNPSPAQGWQHMERASFLDRAKPDAVMALAFEHHLAIGKNIPLSQVLDWIVSLAPNGIIEFVDKGDPTIVTMLAMREDIFGDYTQAAFEAALLARAKIVEKRTITKSGRTLYWFKRHA